MVSSDDYYPFGMILNGRSTNAAYTNAKYKFTGKELDTETGYDYFGSRYYDSRIGRWLSSDPLTDLSSSISPYAYCFNNPLNYTDPDGKWPWDEPNYIWDDELGRWRLRSIDEILAITGREKLNKYSVEHNGDNSLATTLLVTGVSTIAIGTTTVLGGLLGLITIGLSGDTDPHQRQLLMNENVNTVDESGEEGRNQSQDKKLVKEVLKGKKGSIKNAPLPPDSPSWEEIENKTMGEIKDGANKNLPDIKLLKNY
ncbi:MAG TPA: RHS repeat-associated core domain-containing protein [Ignavibacteriaceae bacterium]|nr:RHS repeat-associated core domain-containing protein [Ignavibacteriaceae bacterium]HOJ06945.1 RHS repeat-associated core domain-containing protein [Ignavibacteriaceae bacterium]